MFIDPFLHLPYEVIALPAYLLGSFSESLHALRRQGLQSRQDCSIGQTGKMVIHLTRNSDSDEVGHVAVAQLLYQVFLARDAIFPRIPVPHLPLISTCCYLSYSAV